jgi:NitT/TauT family transport system permease protein
MRERPAPPEPLTRRLWKRFGKAVVTLVNVGAFFALWQWAVASGSVPDLFIPRPSDVVKATLNFAASGQLWLHASFSLQNFAIGFVLSVVVGVPLGLLMGASRWVDLVLGPYVWSLYATPRIALVPLFILWLGFDAPSKILIIFLSAVMPILISSMDGVKTVDQSLLKAARVFGASKRQLYTRVILPFTVPFIMTGIRQGVGRALIGLLVAEFLGSSRGLGFAIARAGQQLDPPTMFGLLVLLVALSVFLVYVMGVLERVVAPWREEVRV